MDENVKEIGDEKFAEVSTYRGKTKVHLRQWYTKKDGKLARTQKGVSFTAEEWLDFITNWEDIKEFVEKGFNDVS